MSQTMQFVATFWSGAAVGAAFVWFAVPALKAKIAEARAKLKAAL